MTSIRIVLGLIALSLLAGCEVRPQRNSELSQNQRSRCFNDGWKFNKGEVVNGQFPIVSDSSWRDVDLPHDWSIEGPFQKDLASATAYLPGGIGWYRKTFSLPLETKGKRVLIRFDGIYENSQVWCNGFLVGQRPFGFISFEYDLTPFLKFGAFKNLIAVRVDHTNYADARWYTGSGIYRNVYLTISNPVHVGFNGTFVTTPQVTKDDAAVVAETTVRNDSPTKADVTVTSIIRDAQGGEAGRAVSHDTISALSERKFTNVAGLKKRILWSTTQPYLYDMDTQVRHGGILVDEYHTPFGVRTVSFDPDRGFFLNGKNLKIKGVCLHQDAGALGVAIPPQVWVRRLKTLADAGCNAIRMSHNPPAPELLDLCDQMGFLVMDEAFDEWNQGKKKWIEGKNKGKPGTDGYHTSFDQWAQIDLHDMIVRDRNHPSIILWSIGNEIDYVNDAYPPNSPVLPPIAAMLIRTVKELDTSRPVTAACASIKSNLFADLLDVVGYNYQESRYAADHLEHPRRIIYGSENGPGAATWNAVQNRKYISAQFLWTGIDYLGEARAWPTKSSDPGMLDLAGFPKARFYQQKCLWTDEPVVHVVVHRDTALCFSNCDEVELFQDGKSLGVKEVPPSCEILWPLLSAGDNLKAVGRNDSDEVCEYEVKRPGEARKLTISSDSARLNGDGRDVAQVEVEVADAQGIPVSEGSNLITCSVTGPARILGIESGDPSSVENYKTDHHTAHNGRVLIYLEAQKTAGEVVLSVSTPGLEAARTTIDVK